MKTQEQTIQDILTLRDRNISWEEVLTRMPDAAGIVAFVREMEIRGHAINADISAPRNILRNALQTVEVQTAQSAFTPFMRRLMFTLTYVVPATTLAVIAVVVIAHFRSSNNPELAQIRAEQQEIAALSEKTQHYFNDTESGEVDAALSSITF